MDRRSGEIRHRHFRDVPEILRPGDLLVLNNTRVTALRLFGYKDTGGVVEMLLLKEVRPGAFECLAKPGRRLKPGARILLGETLAATVQEDLGDRKIIFFEAKGDLQERLRALGEVPLPPYVHEKLADDERYQTVYASTGGSAAAPTAGLHFTSELLAELQARAVEVAFVTLDVGIDTFRPVSNENLDEHVMHGEVCTVSKETAEKVAHCKGRIVAVGTTAVRTLETFATGPRRLEAGRRTSTLFIKPGYTFKIPDGMFTNFHMPRTTMLLMISAFSDRESVLKAYAGALRNRYRFLSFGDSMLIL